MYESKTYDFILTRMLDRVSSELDKREGSIIYDALAPAAAELAQMYIDLNVVLQETFGDKASREYLILRAAERGITPRLATYAVGKGVFNVAVPIGSRFSIDNYNYTVTELISAVDHSYRMTCETAGEGLGTAPLDHVVTVVGASEQAINIATTITYTSGWDFTEVEPYIQEVLDTYFLELNKTWQNVDNIIVRISQIESRLLDLEGIVDIYDTTINSSSSNYVVDTDSIVVRGTVSG